MSIASRPVLAWEPQGLRRQFGGELEIESDVDRDSPRRSADAKCPSFSGAYIA